MTHNEFFTLLAKEKGKFVLSPQEGIRHKTLRDYTGIRCCPLNAICKRLGYKRFSNLDVFSMKIQLKLSGPFISAADQIRPTHPTIRKLRNKMLKILGLTERNK